MDETAVLVGSEIFWLDKKNSLGFVVLIFFLVPFFVTNRRELTDDCDDEDARWRNLLDAM